MQRQGLDQKITTSARATMPVAAPVIEVAPTQRETLLSMEDYRHVLPDGEVLQLQATSPLLSALIMMEYGDSEPKPPVQTVNQNGVTKEEVNDTDETYLAELKNWRDEVNGKMGIANLTEGIVLNEDQLAEVDKYRQRMKRLAVKLPDEPNLIYITMKNITNEELGKIGAKIYQITSPTEEVVEKAGNG